MNKEKLKELFYQAVDSFYESEQMVIEERSTNFNADLEDLEENCEQMKNEFLYYLNEQQKRGL